MFAFLILEVCCIVAVKIPNEIEVRKNVAEPVRPIDPIPHLELAKSATLERNDIKEDDHRMKPVDNIDAIDFSDFD